MKINNTYDMVHDTIDERMQMIAKRVHALQRTSNARIWNVLIDVIKMYLSGSQSDAFQNFYSLFSDNISSIRFSCLKKDANLYRMRTGKNGYEEFNTKEEMFHIPFEYNHLVRNERYSISGFPSLYFGSSVYVCWEEMRRPELDYTNIALFKPVENIKVLDLSNPNFLHFTNERFSDCLVLACSMLVKEPSAPFKPEYIIPQMLLQSLVKYNQENKNGRIEGIKYTSTHIKDNSLWIDFPANRNNKDLFVNYVFPAFDRKEKGISCRLDGLFQFNQCITYNKMRLMYPNYEYDINDTSYNRSVFGKMEQLLQFLAVKGKLFYDKSNPIGALNL